MRPELRSDLRREEQGDEAEIRQLIADAQKHQFDIAELLKLHDDEAVIVNMAGRRVFGKALIVLAQTTAVRG